MSLSAVSPCSACALGSQAAVSVQPVPEGLIRSAPDAILPSRCVAQPTSIGYPPTRADASTSMKVGEVSFIKLRLELDCELRVKVGVQMVGVVTPGVADNASSADVIVETLVGMAMDP